MEGQGLLYAILADPIISWVLSGIGAVCLALLGGAWYSIRVANNLINSVGALTDKVREHERRIIILEANALTTETLKRLEMLLLAMGAEKAGTSLVAVLSAVITLQEQEADAVHQRANFGRRKSDKGDI